MFTIDVVVPDHEVPFTCPKCAEKTLKKLSWLVSHDDFACVCGVKVAIKREEFIAIQAGLNSFKEDVET